MSQLEDIARDEPAIADGIQMTNPFKDVEQPMRALPPPSEYAEAPTGNEDIGFSGGPQRTDRMQDEADKIIQEVNDDVAAGMVAGNAAAETLDPFNIKKE